LANEVPNVKGANACIPNGIRHVEVFLKPSKASIGDVDAVEIAIGRLIGKTI